MLTVNPDFQRPHWYVLFVRISRAGRLERRLIMRAKVVQLLSVLMFAGLVGTSRAQVPASEHVTLEIVHGMKGGCGAGSFDFVRNLPNGSRDNINVDPSGAFRIPKGKVLVVTDVDWQYVHPNGSAGAGAIQVLRLFVENPAKPNLTQRQFESTVTLSNLGQGGISERMTSGFIVSSEARICPDVTPGPEGPPSGLQHLIVRGYLAPDK